MVDNSDTLDDLKLRVQEAWTDYGMHFGAHEKIDHTCARCREYKEKAQQWTDALVREALRRNADARDDALQSAHKR